MGQLARQRYSTNMLGVRGADFGLRALFGSNTNRVLRQALCPVLIARPRTQGALAREAA